MTEFMTNSAGFCTACFNANLHATYCFSIFIIIHFIIWEYFENISYFVIFTVCI